MGKRVWLCRAKDFDDIKEEARKRRYKRRRRRRRTLKLAQQKAILLTILDYRFQVFGGEWRKEVYVCT